MPTRHAGSITNTNLLQWALRWWG